VDLDLPPVTQSFNETHTYVWLPVDDDTKHNPWHIWIDVVSKFRLMEKRWSTNFARFCYILPNHSPYFEKVCKALFPDVKIVVMPLGETWQFKHLIVPSMSNSKDGVIVPPLAPWLRHFKGLNNLKGVTPHRKIVVLRPGAKTRQMLNSDELLLKLKGWETVALENLSIKDQMKTFAEASHVLAAHGAGLTNLLWCQPGTKIIEIQDKNMLHKKVYPLLSHNLDLEHKVYTADVVQIPRQKGNKLEGVKRFSDMINFKINIPDIMEHLE
jgi:capsular polysaccharide biosynthesis protein